MLPVWLYHVQLYVGLVLTDLHNLNEAGNSFQELHEKEMSEFISLIQVVSCAEILCWPFILESINYFSFDLCVCLESAGLFLVLLS